MSNTLFLPFRFARRELRAGTHGFRLFIACLILGVAAIAGIGSISAAAISGIAANAKAILGGDMEVRLTHRAATPEELAAIERNGEISHVIEMRAMAKPTTDGALPVLVELKGADQVYPLYGALSLSDQKPLAELLAQQPDGSYGALPTGFYCSAPASRSATAWSSATRSSSSPPRSSASPIPPPRSSPSARAC